MEDPLKKEFHNELQTDCCETPTFVDIIFLFDKDVFLSSEHSTESQSVFKNLNAC